MKLPNMIAPNFIGPKWGAEYNLTASSFFLARRTALQVKEAKWLDNAIQEINSQLSRPAVRQEEVEHLDDSLGTPFGVWSLLFYECHRTKFDRVVINIANLFAWVSQ